MSTFAKRLDEAEAAFSHGDIALAEKLLKPLLRAAPRHSRANELMAYVAGNRGDMRALLSGLETATASADASPTAWYYLGAARARASRLTDAEVAFRRALSLDDAFFEAWHDLGRTLQDLGRYTEAEHALRRACALKPDSFESHHNLARALDALGRHEDALAECNEAIRLNPAVPENWLNRGDILHHQVRLAEALESYVRAQQLRGNYPEAKANEAIVRLATGDWGAGWPAFEARWRGAGALRPRHASLPRWTGAQSIAGQRILAWCEQGMGDTLQFCRYEALLRAKGAQVVLEVQPDLKPLLQQSLACSVVAVGESIPACDAQIPLLSLPLAFGTRLDSVPWSGPYVAAPAAWIEKWERRLGPRGPRPRVAFAHSGRSTYRYEAQRRIALEEFASLADVAELVLVQKDVAADDRGLVEARGLDVKLLGEEIADFRDGAAIVANADLVIGIDTSIVHLAGAMGKPVWVLLSPAPEWRWMIERDDSPWYPSARLFRQRTRGDWSAVLADVRRSLVEQGRALRGEKP